jgi:hypothetical protein
VTGVEYDIFTTYSHQDSEFASKLDVALQVNGVKVFLDKRDILPGDVIVESVFAAIACAGTQLVIVSENSVSSPWVRDEIAAGRNRSIGSPV